MAWFLPCIFYFCYSFRNDLKIQLKSKVLINRAFLCGNYCPVLKKFYESLSNYYINYLKKSFQNMTKYDREYFKKDIDQIN
jgi:uncharacterized membrane protein